MGRSSHSQGDLGVYLCSSYLLSHNKTTQAQWYKIIIMDSVSQEFEQGM